MLDLHRDRISILELYKQKLSKQLVSFLTPTVSKKSGILQKNGNLTPEMFTAFSHEKCGGNAQKDMCGEQ